MTNVSGFDDVWDLSGAEAERESGRRADGARAVEQDEKTRRDAQSLDFSSPADSELNRKLQWANDDHKRRMERDKARFDRRIEMHRVTHDRCTNYWILGVVSLLFLFAVGVLSFVAYQTSNTNTLRDKAITLLAPLTGLALGFLSGKIKWPVL